MNLADPTAATTTEQRLAALEAAHRSLRLQFMGAVITLIIFCASLNVFLFRQTSGVSKQTGEAAKFVANYYTNTAPQLSIFVGRLQDYAKRDPDFQKVLARYLNPAENPNPAPPAMPGTQGRNAPSSNRCRVCTGMNACRASVCSGFCVPKKSGHNTTT